MIDKSIKNNVLDSFLNNISEYQLNEILKRLNKGTLHLLSYYNYSVIQRHSKGFVRRKEPLTDEQNKIVLKELIRIKNLLTKQIKRYE